MRLSIATVLPCVVHGAALWAGVPQADLALSATASPAVAAPGAPLTYTLTVTNLGPDASPSVTLFSLLANSTFRSADPPVCVATAPPVTCTLGPLAVGATATVALQVDLVPFPVPFAANNAFAQGPLADPDPGNNQPSVFTPVAVPGPATELAHGTDLQGTSELAEGTAGDSMRIRQQPFSSYEVVVDATSGDVVGPSGILLERVGADFEPALQTAAAVGIGPSRSLRFVNSTSSVVDGETVRVRTGDWPVPGDGNDVYALRARETTLAVPRFNNSGTQATVLLLQNPTAAPARATLYFWSEPGVLLATHGPVEIAPRGLLVLDTRTVAGAARTAGSITIAHDAPYGALAGKAVAVEPATGLAFDTPAQPRIR